MKNASQKKYDKKTVSAFLSFIFLLLTNLSINAQANFDWAKKVGGISSDYGSSVAVDASGNVYTTGGFQGTVDFDPGPGTFTLASAGGFDIFISKLDATGNFVWAKSIGGNLSDFGSSITVDASGNIYTTGYFQGTVDFDPSLSTFTLVSAGSNDIFISKLDASGNFVWAKRIGDTSSDIGNSITVDASGNVYTTGGFQGTVDFDPGPGTFTLVSAGSSDIFISKLDATGNFVWAKKMGGTSSETGSSIAVDASGNVYTTGIFQGTVDFDSGAGTFALVSAGADDIFISKLDINGDFVWAKKVGGTSLDIVSSIAIDVSGNVYTTGYFQGTVDFDPGVGTFTLASAGAEDNFISKLDINGNFVWAKKVGGTSYDNGGSIAIDGLGNVYTTGAFNGTVDFDPSLGTYTLASVGSNDIFISKLDGAGNFIWAKTMGGSGGDEAYSITIDASYNIYTTGTFQTTVDFDPGAGNFSLSSAGSVDVFIHKMSQCVAPLAPTNTTSSSNQTICENNTTTLSATSSGTVNWYATPTSTTVLATGFSYTTSVLSTGTYTFYAEASTCTVSATRTAITLTVNSSPTVSVNSGSICSGSSFTITPSGATTYTISGGSSVVSPTTNVSYNVTGISAQGCVSSNTAVSSVTVNALPNVTAITSNSLLCTGETTSLTASGASTYLWNTSATTSVIAISPTVTTNYTVTGTDANGCENSSTITQSVSLCTGISATQSIDASFNIYPNPSNGLFTITGVELNTTITIYNAIGELVKSTQSISTNPTIDLSDYSNGIYFIKIKNSNGEAIHKLIKQ
jgi:hypothetical protein